MKERARSIAGWVMTIAVGVAAGLVAARFRLFDSVAAVVALAVVVVILIAIGLRAMAEPWGDWED